VTTAEDSTTTQHKNTTRLCEILRNTHSLSVGVTPFHANVPFSMLIGLATKPAVAALTPMYRWRKERKYEQSVHSAYVYRLKINLEIVLHISLSIR